MRLDWSAEQSALRARFLAIGAAHAQVRDRFAAAAWADLTDAGLWSLPVPVAMGGRGGSWWDFVAAFEGLAAGMPSAALLMSVANQAAVLRALTDVAVESVRAHYLPELLRGRLCATAIAERSTGSDLKMLETRVQDDAQGGLQLVGRKFNISHAPTAHYVLVAARHASTLRNGLALAIVEVDRLGVRRSAGVDKLGLADLPVGDLEFDRVALTPHDLLCGVTDAARDFADITSLSRVLFGLAGALLVLPQLDETLTMLQSRPRADQPLSDHQHVQSHVVDIKHRAERARWLAYAALQHILTRHAQSGVMASLAKLSGSEAVVEGAVDLLRLHGSMGYREGPISRLSRDALAWLSVGGTEDVHKVNVFNQMARAQRGSRRAEGVTPGKQAEDLSLVPSRVS